LMEGLRIDHAFGPTTRDLFTPGRTAALVAPGGAFGTIGELTAATAERYGFTNRVVAAELELGRLLELARDPGAALEPPKFPPVLLDLAVASTASGTATARSRSTGGNFGGSNAAPGSRASSSSRPSSSSAATTRLVKPYRSAVAAVSSPIVPK